MPDRAGGVSIARGASTPALALAGVSAVLASTCCVVPLFLTLLGLSGAWLSQLRWLAPYSTALVLVAAGLLAMAGRQLFRRPNAAAAACDTTDQACRTTQAAARRWFWLVLLLTLVPVLVPIAAPFFY